MEFNDLSEKEQKLVVSCKYDLFRDKAIKLKEKGIDNCIYDFDFDFKGVKITEDARNLIDLVVPQIINYQGLTFLRPLEGLGIGGFYYFMSLFFLERRRQLATRFEGHTMDSMLMRNSVTGNEMWLVNKVDEISDEEIERYMKK
jgi:hypothetical protein|tara:strand:- start:849 stop:1280 length:432 start_codon:yes stop_codon:yes gene_type:complete